MVMTVYLGFRRSNAVRAEVADCGAGAGKVRCFECEGTGDWTRFHPPSRVPVGKVPCVNCKGTGYVYVSI
jgi:hypothetical protein